jgi:hypothetical protein
MPFTEGYEENHLQAKPQRVRKIVHLLLLFVLKCFKCQYIIKCQKSIYYIYCSLRTKLKFLNFCKGGLQKNFGS